MRLYATVMAFYLLVCLSISVLNPDISIKSHNTIVSNINSVYDGDTFNCDIDNYPPIIGDNILIRINGIDCPEMKDQRPAIKQLAIKARDYSKNALESAKVVTLAEMQRDKYFRINARVYVDGKDLGQLLIKKKLAKKYDGGTKSEW